MLNIKNKILLSVYLILLVGSYSSFATVLPEDRADALYHAYDGGGVTISGPSILVRKKVLESFSVSANYYVDMVSSASIDVETTASAYTEERTQYSVGVDYLRGKSIMSFNYTNSTESDYIANTTTFGISQDFFGDLTTLSIGYSQGDDTVKKNGQPDFEQPVKRQNYRLGLSQIITKNFLINLATETVTDEGFLNNPYRSVRFLDPSVPIGYSYQAEQYPNTKTSTAGSIIGKYFLPYHAAVSLEYRIYSDTWGVNAQNYEIAYTQPIGDHFIVDLAYRNYSQDHGNFYSDLFPFQNSQNFLARDKELSTYTSNSFGMGVSYNFKMDFIGLDKGSLNLFVNYFQYKYDDFRDLRVQDTPGTEPFYNYNAIVTRAFISLWY